MKKITKKEFIDLLKIGVYYVAPAWKRSLETIEESLNELEATNFRNPKQKRVYFGGTSNLHLKRGDGGDSWIDISGNHVEVYECNGFVCVRYDYIDERDENNSNTVIYAK